MDWEQRFRTMILAGGALASVAGCHGEISSGVGGCCNANGDPCCEFLHCGGSMSPECACQLDGGTFAYAVGNEGGTVASCSFPDDAGHDARD